MKAILIDDEVLALEGLEALLNQLGVEVIGKYISAREGMKRAEEESIDIIFMDIEMPEESGIKLAREYMQKYPELVIIFVTAYDKYAVEAFEIRGFDYILKPVSKERLKKSLGRMMGQSQVIHEAVQKENVKGGMIRFFGKFEIELPVGAPISLLWRTPKAQEIFIYLLYRHNQVVRKDFLVELFWPDLEKDKGYANLYTTVYQIRKTLASLSHRIRIINSNDGYWIDLKEMKIDVEEWKERLKSSHALKITLANIFDHMELIRLHRGPYLQYCHAEWAVAERQYLKMLEIQHTGRVAHFYMNHGQTEKGESILRDRDEKYSDTIRWSKD